MLLSRLLLHAAAAVPHSVDHVFMEPQQPDSTSMAAHFFEALHVMAIQCSRAPGSPVRVTFDFADALASALPACRLTMGDFYILHCAKDGRRGLRGRTWLMAAAAHNDMALVRRLCDVGVDLNLLHWRGDMGRGGQPFTTGTALTLAAAHGHAEIVRELLERGADAAAALDIRSGVHLRKLRAHPDLARELCTAPGVSHVDAVDAAFELRLPDVIRSRFAEAPDSTWTEEDLVDDLLDSIHDDDDGASATLRAFAEHPVVPHAVRVMVAGRVQDEAWLRALWDLAPDEPGLMAAAATVGSIELIQRAIEQNVDINNIDMLDSHPVDLAATYSHYDVMQFLCAQDDIDLDQAILTACEHARGLGDDVCVVVASLLYRGAEVDGAVFDFIADGRYPLAFAIHADNAQLVRLLCEHGAQDPRNLDHKIIFSALGLACELAQPECVSILLEFGFSYDEPSMYPGSASDFMTPTHLTPLMHAAKTSGDSADGTLRRADVIRKLLAAGANPALMNAEGKTARELATNATVLAAFPPLALCKKGCGRHAKPGAFRQGRAWDTCCRECAMGQGVHSAECDQRVTVDTA